MCENGVGGCCGVASFSSTVRTCGRLDRRVTVAAGLSPAGMSMRCCKNVDGPALRLLDGAEATGWGDDKSSPTSSSDIPCVLAIVRRDCDAAQ